MDPLRRLTRIRGFFSRAQARDVGYDDRAVTRAVRAGHWIRFRRGFYAFADEWRAADEIERHRTRSRAVQHSLGDAVALSHVSAVIAHKIAVWDVDLSRVHVTRLDGGPGRVEGDVIHHEGLCLDRELTEIEGGRVVGPERSVLEAGCRVGQERALVMLDSGLYRAKFTDDELCRQFAAMEHWPWLRSMHIPVRMSRCGAQSPGESRGRFFCWACRLPAPQLQFEVRDASGKLVGTSDWAWPQHGLLGEFDGVSKYGRLLKPGQDVGEVVYAEKQREDALREITGFRMIRVTWSDFERPRLLESRLRAALGLPR